MVTNVPFSITNYINSTNKNTTELPQMKSTVVTTVSTPKNMNNNLPVVQNQTLVNLSNSNMEVAKDNETGMMTLKKKLEKIKKPHVGVVSGAPLSMTPVLDSQLRLENEMKPRAKGLEPIKEKIKADVALLLAAGGISIAALIGLLVKTIVKSR